ncbi:Gelsolin y domain [Orobanche hederae]
MRDLLVEKGIPREIINIYPRDSLNRGFSSNYYFQKMSNGELFDRKWLVYSKELDKVFCFCCKVVRRTLSRSQLSNEGSRDWKYLGDKLTDHESSREHLSNLRAWNELRVRLSRNQTIDKELQEQIKKDTDHWRDVMVRIISVVKRLAVNNVTPPRHPGHITAPWVPTSWNPPG